MPPPRKRAKTAAQPQEEHPTPSALLSDNRAAWLAKSNEQSVHLVARGETLCVHRHVLTKHSEYFEKCLQQPWDEANKGTITFDDIDPTSLALFVGVAYSHSSLVPVQPPATAEAPQCRTDRTPMRDLVEVLKLCDRFICPKMSIFMIRCLHVAIFDGHRALLRADTDESLQRGFMRDFADGYEALELAHSRQKDLAEKMVQYFVGGVSFDIWARVAEEVLVADRARFVGAVSAAFAFKLTWFHAGRKKRKEMPAIKLTE